MAASDTTPLPPIRHRVFIDAPPGRVYDVFTSASHWDNWFTTGMLIEPVAGGHIQFNWSNFGPDHITSSDGGTVLVAEPGECFVFQWHPGESVTTVTVAFDARGTGSVVKLTEDGYSSSQADLEAYVGCATGWGEALTLLKFYIEHDLRYGDVPSSAGTR